jgi:Protein of unknown function (DUF3617)
MNRVWIGVPAVLLTGVWAIGAAQALPFAPGPKAMQAAQPAPLLEVRYRHHHQHHSHHRHYRHYGYLRHGHGRRAREAEPEQTAGGAVKPGRWQFTAELQTPSAPKSPDGAQVPSPRSGGGIKTSYYGCVTSEKAVPAEFGPQCKLDSTERNGPAITWSMICTNPQGAVRSDGVAQYAGDTMEATMISHLPGADGKLTDLTQHINGQYVGPCTQAMQ